MYSPSLEMENCFSIVIKNLLKLILFLKNFLGLNNDNEKDVDEMNKRGGMMTSLLTVSAAGAVIYGVTRGIRNGSFQRWQQTISNTMKNPQVKQFMQPLKNMTNNQAGQQLATNIQNGTNNLQQHAYRNNSNYQ